MRVGEIFNRDKVLFQIYLTIPPAWRPPPFEREVLGKTPFQRGCLPAGGGSFSSGCRKFYCNAVVFCNVKNSPNILFFICENPCSSVLKTLLPFSVPT